MFGSSEDVNGSPMTNVLVRITGASRSTIKTFFLDTVYSGTERNNAEYYVKVATKCISDWKSFDKVAGIVIDNTGSVKNARELMMSTYPRLVASQHQAHVADLLMSDIGEIPWISEVIRTFSGLAFFYRKHRRVKESLLQRIGKYNAEIRRRTGQSAALRDGQMLSSERNETSMFNNTEGTFTYTDAPENMPPHSDGSSTAIESVRKDGLRADQLRLMHLPSEGYVELQNVIEMVWNRKKAHLISLWKMKPKPLALTKIMILLAHRSFIQFRRLQS